MNTKRIPAIVMLLAGSVACIVTYINHYSLKDMLIVLAATLIVFLIIGVAIKMVLDSFDMPTDEEEDRVNDEGEVVEKQGEDVEAEGEDEVGNESNKDGSFE